VLLFVWVLCLSGVWGQPCLSDPDSITACGPTENPTIVAGCPSCRQTGIIVQGCTTQQLQTCWGNQGALAACATGVNPTRSGATCCLSCRPTTPPCTQTQLDQCVTNYNTLTACAGANNPTFSTAACCRSCRRNTNANDAPFNPTTGQCSNNPIYSNIGSIDFCRFGEIPVRTDTNFCIGSCVRSETRCPRFDIVNCYRYLPTCANNEIPTYIPGECCPTCKRPPVACPAACPGGQQCYPSTLTRDANGNYMGTCVAVGTRDFTAVTNSGPFDGTWTPNDIKILIREIVIRFCERTQNSAICLRFGKSNEDIQAKADSWTVTRKANNVITLTYAVDAAADVQGLLTAAFADDFSPSGYGFTNVVVIPDTNPVIIYAPPTGHANQLQRSISLFFTLAIFVALNI